jgi:Zn-dependent peptidase ImmA (M78 family)/DNA-binding XRE family transcriptional regulator
MSKIEALITPEVLRWARDNVAIAIPTAAKRAGVSEDAVSHWEIGRTKPTVRQARLLANLYRIPFAAFFLPEAPAYRIRVPKDYRRLAGTLGREVSSAILIDVQDAWERRAVVLELFEASRTAIPTFEESVSLSDDPEEVGTALRGTLGVSLQEQVSWRESRRGFNSWRAHIEDKGVLVFQAADVPIEEMRAYSIAEFPFPVIVVNRKDVPQARTFSLLHELTHLLLKSAGLCDLSTRVERPPEDQRLEVFCNAVAAACLMPANAVKQHPIVAHRKDGETWTDPEIITLAHYFSVSREAILRRLLTFGLTSSRFYEQKREQYQREFKTTPKPKGFPSPAQDRLSLLGRPFVRLILDSLDSGIVTTSDASDYLGIRLKHFRNLAASLETD